MNFEPSQPVRYVGANPRFRNKIGVCFYDEDAAIHLFVPTGKERVTAYAGHLRRADDGFKLRLPTTENLKSIS